MTVFSTTFALMLPRQIGRRIPEATPEVDCDEIYWLPVIHAARHNTTLIADWLQNERLTCCDFQGGFLIDVENRRWNDGCVDEFWMTVSWFAALHRLLDGEPTATAVVWEEGQLHLERSGDTLTMYETRWTADFCSPVTVSFADFTQQIAREGLHFAAWVRALHAELTANHPNDELLTALQIMGSHSYPESEVEKRSKILHEVNILFAEQAENFAARILR